MRGVEMAARVVGYVRVSRVGGREGDSFISPPLQREQIEAVARREGLEVVQVLEELDASGGDNRRPLWNRAIEMVESREVAGIAVWNLSRFSRSTRDFLNAWDRIERAGGQVYSATENLDHKLLRTILVAVAEAERDRAAEGFRAAQLSAVERGIHIAGRVPLGYRRGADRRLEPDPDASPIVVGLFERKAKGMSHEALARWVQEQGVEGFSSTGVRWVLGNRTYLGEARGAGKVVQGAHPAIVSRALFAKCQTRGVQSQRSGVIASRFLLQGVATCAGCGRGLRLSTSGDGRAFYRCRTTGCRERGYAGAERLDSFVLNRVEELLTGRDYDGVQVAEAGGEKTWRGATYVATLGDEAEVEEARHALEEAREDLTASWRTRFCVVPSARRSTPRPRRATPPLSRSARPTSRPQPPGTQEAGSWSAASGTPNGAGRSGRSGSSGWSARSSSREAASRSRSAASSRCARACSSDGVFRPPPLRLHGLSRLEARALRRGLRTR
jgi:DNA invertase Pin-like site-specific DNA recombinase